MLGRKADLSNRSVKCKAKEKKELFQKAKRSAFIFGIGGYTSLALGNVLQSRGWNVSGTYRDDVSADRLKQLKPNWEVVHFDPCSRPSFISEQLQESLSNSTHVLSSIPPIALPLYDPVLAAQLKVLQVSGFKFDWVGYLSSTGVYGDWGGDWVDERSELRSLSSRGFTRKEHEAAWAKAAVTADPPLPLHIFRLGGIYGPGRSVLESLKHHNTKAGLSSSSSSSSSEGIWQRRGRQKYTARCHVSDICSTVISSMELNPETPLRDGIGAPCNTSPSMSPLEMTDVTCVVDDDPAPRSQVVAYTQQLLMDLAPQSSTAASLARASFAMPPSSGLSAGEANKDQHAQRQWGRRECSSSAEGLEEKRVRNAKLKHTLLREGLQFPSYREGMLAIVNGDLQPFGTLDLEYLGLS